MGVLNPLKQEKGVTTIKILPLHYTKVHAKMSTVILKAHGV